MKAAGDTAAGKLARRRPAEVATPPVMALAMLAGSALDLSAQDIAYVAVVFAFVPAAITWTVELIRE